jgi:uncharacterized protein YlxW (UPF0749 family)
MTDENPPDPAPVPTDVTVDDGGELPAVADLDGPQELVPEEPIAEDSPAEDVPVEEASAGDSSADDAATGEDTSDEGARAEKPPVSDAPAEATPAEGPPAEDDAAADPADEVDVLDADVVARTAAGADANEVAAEAGAADAVAADQDRVRAAGTIWVRALDLLRRPRLTGAGTVIVVLIGLLGFTLIAQVKSNSNVSTLDNDRPDDLVRILSDLDARKDRLSSEITTLNGTVARLTSGAQGRQAALSEAAKRADELGILAGTLPAEGRGLSVQLSAGRGPIQADDVLNAVEELRGAGAEAMSIGGSSSANGGSVRIVASTYFTDATGGLDVSGQVLSGPFTIDVIGEPQTMATALNIPGGVVDSIQSGGGNVRITQSSRVQVTATYTPGPLRYAQPVS